MADTITRDQDSAACNVLAMMEDAITHPDTDDLGHIRATVRGLLPELFAALGEAPEAHDEERDSAMRDKAVANLSSAGLDEGTDYDVDWDARVGYDDEGKFAWVQAVIYVGGKGPNGGAGGK